MSKATVKYKNGDSLIVKLGVIDPDFNKDIGGWQGRVITVTPDKQYGALIGIAWDSLTLKQMPGEIIEKSEMDGLDWTQMGLGINDVTPAQARDTPTDVQRIVDQISTQYAWASFGEQGRRIQQVLKGITPDFEMEFMEAWENHLTNQLTFPFAAVVSESSERGALRFGEKVTVTGIDMADDLYGVIALIKLKNRRLSIPMCDLEVVDKDSTNYEVVDDYSTWFANR